MLNCIVLEHGRSCFESYFAFYLLLQMLFTLEGSGLRVKKSANKLCFLQDSGCITCKFALLGWVDLVYFQGVTVCQHVLKIRPETLQIAENVFKTWLERRNWHHVRQTRQCQPDASNFNTLHVRSLRKTHPEATRQKAVPHGLSSVSGNVSPWQSI